MTARAEGIGVLTSGTRHGWPVWTGVTCVECPGCGFTFGADHENTNGTGYSCPVCELREALVL